MAFLSNLFKRQKMLSGSSPVWILNQGQSVSIKPKAITSAIALKNSDVYAVISRVSSDIAGCRFVTNAQPITDVLNAPLGNLMSGFSVWQAMIVQMMLTGNAFAIIDRDTNGYPVRIEPVPNEKVTVALDDYGKDLTYTIHFDDSKRSGDFLYDSSEVIHFRCTVSGESDTQYMGIPPIDSLLNEIEVQDLSSKLAISTLRHAIKPSIFIKVPNATLGKEAKENTRQSFEDQTTGENAGRAVVLDQSADVETTNISPNVTEFLQNVSFSQDQIAKAFGIPADYLSGKQDAQSNITMIRAFYQSSLSIYIKPIESELSQKLGTDVKLDIASAIDSDNSELINNVQKLASAGVLAPIQAQKLLKNRGVFPELDLDEGTNLLDNTQNINDKNN
ncbi:phage portal protein [Lactobacillus mulieris]|jgi:phage portal protein, HK97 family|uniref:phage portal protein n=1 Tax=Lactobacillus TaxID=1578 RepID=UPI0001A44E77|nr:MULTISPECIES: phage portal protein [Lactobacillus]EEQ24684.1 phage portal protein, HK97 family [Lactobacillus jensenii 269-3]EEQ68480.2 phage portal protein, HK97 family [Lactobacillus jensenii 1153]MCW8105947.1 phage portal protein [Lactobacillus mulieris]MDK7348439.1 phage portal protein [Lactobacillus mulieris]